MSLFEECAVPGTMIKDPTEGKAIVNSVAVRVGCAGWSIPPRYAHQFVGSGSHLQRYAQVLNCSEINSSFRRVHKTATWERWAASVPGDFRFSIKMPKTITHDTKLKCSAELLIEFFEQIRSLNDRLGPVLVQTPPSLEFENGYVSSFFSLLRQHYLGDVVCEPRHGSWFVDVADTCLRDFHVARVASDPARVPAAANPGGLRTLVYFRLHGSPRPYDSRYLDESVKELARKAEKLAGTARVWCVFDNTASGWAIENAIALRTELARDRP
jgi:uncharacterized protein YecE (DUF72 family)